MKDSTGLIVFMAVLLLASVAARAGGSVLFSRLAPPRVAWTDGIASLTERTGGGLRAASDTWRPAR